jgi:PPP family 3-phenylpropionic acid transporter
VRPAGAGAGRSPLPAYAALSAAYFAAVGLFNPYAPLWFQSLGYTTLLIGGIASLQSWTRIFAPYAWGWWGDHRGRRVGLIRLAAAGALASALALLGVREALPVAVLTALMFLANGGVVPLYEATLAQHLNTPDGVDAKRYGRVRLWGSVGFITSVTLFGALLERTGIGVFPIFVAAMNALLLAAALRLPATRDEIAHDEPAPPVLPRLRRPPLAWLQAAALVTAARFAVAALAGTLAGPWAGLGAALLVLTQLSHALTFAAQHTACIQLVQQHFPGRLRGRGQALYTTLGYGLPGVAGGVGGGWLVEHAGFPALFGAASLAGLASWGAARRAGHHASAG